MENQEHPEFNEDAAFDEAAKSLETGELTADSLPSDADKTEKDKPDQLESEPEQQEKVEQDDLPDWLQSATDEVKENFRKLEADKKRYQHQARSQNGRVGALTKKYQQAAAELERLKQNQSTPQFTDNLARISEDYPDVAEVLNKYLAHQDKRLSDISQLSSQLAETKMQELSEQVLDSNIAYVTEIVPDAEQILANPQFTTWLQRQPVGIQALYTSDDVNDAIYLLSEYKKVVSANEVRKAKQNQQLSALSLPNGRTVPKGGEEIDEDAFFNQIAAQFDKQRSRY